MPEETTVTTAEYSTVESPDYSVILNEISENFSTYAQNDESDRDLLHGKLDEIILKVDLVQEAVAYQNSMLGGIFGIGLVIFFGYIFFKKFL